MLSEQALAQPDALRVTSTSSSLLMKSVIAQTELDGRGELYGEVGR